MTRARGAILRALTRLFELRRPIEKGVISEFTPDDNRLLGAVISELMGADVLLSRGTDHVFRYTECKLDGEGNRSGSTPIVVLK